MSYPKQLKAMPAEDKPSRYGTSDAVVSPTTDVRRQTGRPESTSDADILPAMSRVQVTVEERRLTLSNLEKVLYPEPGFSKGQVIDYYTRIAPVLLPHLHDRPVTLKRYPRGIDAPFFYEKRCPRIHPDWIQTLTVAENSAQGRGIKYCLINDLPTLVWIANLAALELHPSLSVGRDLEHPSALVFDLDPGAPAGLYECCGVALDLRALLKEMGLESFVKTSGGKGLQVYVPLNSDTPYSEARQFVKAIAQMFERNDPDAVTSKMLKSLRVGKVFIDWSQNRTNKTTVSVYSLRAGSDPTVSTPVTWEEIESAYESGNTDELVFDSAAVLQRVEEMGDIFAPVLTLKQTLPK